MLLQAPYDMEFHVTTPFDGFTCITPLFTENPFNLPLQNFDAGSFEAVFDSGDNIPLNGKMIDDFLLKGFACTSLMRRRGPSSKKGRSSWSLLINCLCLGFE